MSQKRHQSYKTNARVRDKKTQTQEKTVPVKGDNKTTKHMKEPAPQSDGPTWYLIKRKTIEDSKEKMRNTEHVNCKHADNRPYHSNNVTRIPFPDI